MTVLEFLVKLRDEWKCIPLVMNGNKPVEPSNSQIRRWCNDGAVMLNGNRVAHSDEVVFPVESLTFFKGNKIVRLR